MRNAVRQAIAVDAGKAAGIMARVTGRGGGTALPGLVALRLAPDLVGSLTSSLRGGSIIITGTNGKTTTSMLVGRVLEAGGVRSLRNASGSNLMRGLASSLIHRANVLGTLPAEPALVGLFEVDEAALSSVVPAVHPTHVVLLDLFRDQLDRYGEVATVAREWTTAFKRTHGELQLIANADDPLVASVAQSSGLETVYFGITGTAGAPVDHASDVKACPICGGVIRYDRVVFGHLGSYACTQCSFKRPHPDIVAQEVETRGVEGSTFLLETPAGHARVDVKLPGLYNVYNAVAAVAVGLEHRMNLDAVVGALQDTSPAFGRMERIDLDGRHLYLALAKNPTGFNEVLRTLRGTGHALNLLVLLNDKIADGRDVSWIWDTDVELLDGHLSHVVFAGTRAEDIALRFKYAGLLPSAAWEVQHDTEMALSAALRHAAPGDDVFVVPTYTAMLDVRRVLTRRGHVRAYWEE